MNRLIYIVLLLTFPCLIPSALATWLSPDTLMDKYPHISPYAYCNWNPVNRIDPDGRDIWELDNDGNIVNNITDKTQDAIRMNDRQISFEYNSILNITQNENHTTFSFVNEDVAANAFKFMADNSSVEYGLVNCTQSSTVVTQHLKGKVSIGDVVDAAISNNEVIKSFIHNHPNNSGPSGYGMKKGDRQSIQKLEAKLGYNIQSYIYQPGTESLWFFTPSYRGNEGLGWNGVYPNAKGRQSNTSPSWMYQIKNLFGLKIRR